MQDGQKKNAQEGVRYSLRGTTDGRTVAVVDEDILSNIDLTQWNKQTKKEVQAAAKEALKKFGNGIVVDGITRSVNKVSRNEYTGSKYSEKISGDTPRGIVSSTFHNFSFRNFSSNHLTKNTPIKLATATTMTLNHNGSSHTVYTTTTVYNPKAIAFIILALTLPHFIVARDFIVWIMTFRTFRIIKIKINSFDIFLFLPFLVVIII